MLSEHLVHCHVHSELLEHSAGFQWFGKIELADSKATGKRKAPIFWMKNHSFWHSPHSSHLPLHDSLKLLDFTRIFLAIIQSQHPPYFLSWPPSFLVSLPIWKTMEFPLNNPNQNLIKGTIQSINQSTIAKP